MKKLSQCVWNKPLKWFRKNIIYVISSIKTSTGVGDGMAFGQRAGVPIIDATITRNKVKKKKLFEFVFL